MRRPLLPVAILFTGGILLASRVALSPFVLLGISSALVVLAFAWDRARPLVLWLLIPCASWADYAVGTWVISPHDLRRLVGGEAALVTFGGGLLETPSL